MPCLFRHRGPGSGSHVDEAERVGELDEAFDFGPPLIRRNRKRVGADRARCEVRAFTVPCATSNTSAVSNSLRPATNRR
ncbi:hypothetical protein YM304_39130 [Ilumatobacter coccineus YM16-304]|uniref:Uncharacterized protein n=1 Tax=Ilumatobacter coccineus (strain NBRC 103263 / KCTC 29153 / YM16-304) TaxID=1313172 RepID=A0A6C7EBV9_ILUCY|nr:hypothetical protein YM304_39130 [Ilumatobacter coccineus YM16-304]